MWTCAGVLLLAACVSAITRDQFYPYGPELDVQLPRGHEIVCPEIPLAVPMFFYGEEYDSIFVNNFGVLTFRAEMPTFINSEFPLPYPSIAAFYSNVDTSEKGTVYYRETNDTRVTVKAAETVQENFAEYYDFHPTSVFIATWADVAYAGNIARTNTYQAVIISNGTESFVELLYPEREIQWIQAETQEGSYPEAKAQVGFISEDGRVFTVRGSGSHQIRNIVSWSNIHEPGKYIFRVGNILPDGVVALPDQYNQEQIEDEEESKTCALSGPSVCHLNAKCVDYQAGICCECNDGYYGNGKTCIRNDVPLRVHGKLFGDINGELLNDVTFQSYVVMNDAKAYTALSQGPVSIGSSLQSLNILGGVIGWLFAKPIANAKNGYQLTGALFNHTAEVFFPKTGDKVSIKQEFLGHDVFDQISIETEIHGTVPVIGPNDKLHLGDYTEDYTFVDRGVIRSQSTRVITNLKDDFEDEQEQRITQTFTFNTCRFLPNSDEDKIPYTLEVSKNYLGFEDNIIRYGMSNKVAPIGHEDPCVKGQQTCGVHSVCVVNGESFQCICNNGFALMYQQRGQTCVDIDECQTGAHNCDVNAECHNYEGAFGCRCKAGYEGNGVTCKRKQSGCSGVTCDLNAQCIENYVRDSLLFECVCNPGFSGSGHYCYPIKDTSCRDANICSPHAECTINPETEQYACQCNRGYSGNGYDCVLEIYSTTTDGGEAEYNDRFVLPACTDYGCECPYGYSQYVDARQNKLCQKSEYLEHPEPEYNTTGMVCDNDNHCPPNARCLYSETSRVYECQCPPGFEGDGYECIEKPATECDICGNNAHCVNISTHDRLCVCDVGYHGDGFNCRPNLSCSNNSDCEYNAECRYDTISGAYVCQCVDGYKKDENDACILDEHMCNGAVCVEHATCMWDESLGIDYCHCNEGYEGSGVDKCVEIGRACNIANDCSIDAVCTMTEYGFECVCKEGFTGDGYTCTPEPNCRNIPHLCDEHASCLVKNDEYICECNAGYNGNGSYCQLNPRKPGNFLITSDSMFVYKVPFDSGSREFAVPINVAMNQIAIGMDVDCQTGRIYWGDLYNKVIKSSAYDGSAFEHFLETDIEAEGLAIDWVSRNIFWPDSKKLTIEVANLNTKVRRVLFKDGIVNPRGIAVHPGRGKVFWTDWNRRGPKIEWANMDGTGRRIFLRDPDVYLPNSLAIDWDTNELCYTDAGLHKIICVNLDTKEREVKVDNCKYPFGLAITNNKYYWTDWKTANIEFMDKRTKAKGTLPKSGGKLYGITVAQDQCTIAVQNLCYYNHGHCGRDQLCLPNEENKRSCLPGDL